MCETRIITLPLIRESKIEVDKTIIEQHASSKVSTSFNFSKNRNHGSDLSTIRQFI